jgi:uncharacterized membrane protein YccC
MAMKHGERRVGSLRELPQSIEPPRDLWPAIEAQVRSGRGASFGRYSRARWMAAAAVIAALGVGIWIGRSVLPAAGPVSGLTAQSSNAQSNATTPADVAEAVQAAYIADPRYRQERAELVKSLQAQLAALPPQSREKVAQSLATIHHSMQDLQAALGRDPTNALLQELLVNTYQDEMRVLTAVHEASESGKGI